MAAAGDPPPEPVEAGAAEDEDDIEVAPAPRGPRPTPFGSVWDSQLGTPAASSAAPRPPVDDDEDFDEPEIPEYLIAEQRRGANRGGANRGGGARGGRSAYQSAMERERYGRGSGGGGINRYPDVSAAWSRGRAAARGSELQPRAGAGPVGPDAGRSILERAVE